MNVKSTIANARNTGTPVSVLKEREARLDRTVVNNLCGSTRGWNAMVRLLREFNLTDDLTDFCHCRACHQARISMRLAREIESLLVFIYYGSTGADKAKAKRYLNRVRAAILRAREEFYARENA